ncbi:MAG: cytochrome c oxidase subunit II [Thermoanaerobaculia bacterium]|nr:MAG: cytochrome c oxidase subunit II [Thermoanaerobaculia bacterium]
MPFKIPFLPEQASTLARDVDALTLYLVAMASFFTVLVGAMIVYFAIRYRRRAPDEVGSSFDNSALLEITWTVIPVIIVLFTFVWGARVYFRLYRPPADAVQYYVTGKQWMWKTQHPTGQREINELHVPLGQPVKLLMTSEDVIHSFFVPAFRVKADVLPGRYTSIWFTPTKVGRFHLFCAEYCGAEHSRMIGWVTVMEPEDYQAWLAGVPTQGSPAAGGQRIFEQLGCATCHQDSPRALGPALAGVFGHPVALADGSTVIADESYIRESILNPTAKVVAGYQPVMPSFQGQVSEEGILELINYIKTLAPAGSASLGGAASEGAL